MKLVNPLFIVPVLLIIFYGLRRKSNLYSSINNTSIEQRSGGKQKQRCNMEGNNPCSWQKFFCY